MKSSLLQGHHSHQYRRPACHLRNLHPRLKSPECFQNRGTSQQYFGTLSHGPQLRINPRATELVCQAGLSDEIKAMDPNQLHTALSKAVAAEDYIQAAQIKAWMEERGGSPPASWQDLGLPLWLADRASQLGYVLPTDIQRRTCQALQDNRDCIVHSETGSGKTLAFLLPLLARLNYPPLIFPEDLLGPQLIVLVPSMELGTQIAMLVYKLFGGSINAGIPGSSGNMFAYSGPRGLKVRGLLNDEELSMAENIGYLKGVHVLVAMPDQLAELLEMKDFEYALHDLKALAIDEVDAVTDNHEPALKAIFNRFFKQHSEPDRPFVCLVGATVSQSIAAHAVNEGWIRDSAAYVMSGDSLQIPQGVQHRFVVVDEDRKAVVLCRQLRADLERHGEDAAPPRAIIFAENEQQAVSLSSPLRNALWGLHRLTVLLPHGQEPIQNLHAFRDNRATVMISTPIASRGLDLPAVTHIYNLSCPDEAAYIHRAGRVGRIGSETPGVITTFVTSGQKADLQQISKDLGFTLTEEKTTALSNIPDPEQDIDGAKKELEDIYNLMQAEE